MIMRKSSFIINFCFILFISFGFSLFNSCERSDKDTIELDKNNELDISVKKGKVDVKVFSNLLLAMNPSLKNPIIDEVQFLSDGDFKITYFDNDIKKSFLVQNNKEGVVQLTCGGSCGGEACDEMRTTKTSEGWITQCEGCQNCSLIITEIDQPNAKNIISTITNNTSSLKNIAKLSYKNTLKGKIASSELNRNLNLIEVSSIKFSHLEDGNIFALVEYSDSFDNTSTYALLDDGKTVTTIDCTGSCDCKEQYIHATKTTQCSCDQCKMTITVEEVNENPNP